MSEFRRLGESSEERGIVRVRTKQLWGVIVLAVSPPSNVKFAPQVDGDLWWLMFTSWQTDKGKGR